MADQGYRTGIPIEKEDVSGSSPNLAWDQVDGITLKDDVTAIGAHGGYNRSAGSTVGRRLVARRQGDGLQGRRQAAGLKLLDGELADRPSLPDRLSGLAALPTQIWNLKDLMH
jgi:hypothetical protein